MGATWSLMEPDMMRLASRDVCDDETWANTVLNRSSCSVQERLCMLQSEAYIDTRLLPTRSNRNRKRLAFAPMDHVLVFEKDAIELDLDDSDSSEDDDAYEDDAVPNWCRPGLSQRTPDSPKRSAFAELILDTFDSPDISLDGW